MTPLEAASICREIRDLYESMANKIHPEETGGLIKKALLQNIARGAELSAVSILGNVK